MSFRTQNFIGSLNISYIEDKLLKWNFGICHIMIPNLAVEKQSLCIAFLLILTVGKSGWTLFLIVPDIIFNSRVSKKLAAGSLNFTGFVSNA